MADDGGTGTANMVSRQTLAACLQFVDEALIALGADGVITFASPAIRTVLGWDPSDVVGRNVLEFLEPEDVEEIAHNIVRWSGRDGELQANPLRVRTAFGSIVDVTYFVVTGSSIAEIGEFLITVRRADQIGDGHAELLYRLANEGRLVRLASMFLGVGIDDFDRGLDEATVELAGLKWVTRVSIWERTDDHVRRRSFWEADDHAPTLPLPEQVRLSRLPRLAELAEVHFRTPEEIASGGWPGVDEALIAAGVQGLLAVPMNVGGRFSGFVLIEHTFPGVAFDTTHFSTLRAAAAIIAEAFVRHDAELELAKRANTDLLTGLPNRWQFQHVLDSELRRASSAGSVGVGVALFDLDRFKMVNDSLGHEAGDRLLVEVSDRLRTAVAAKEAGEAYVARLGGDEFLLLVTGCEHYDEAARRVEHVLDALGPPFYFDGQPIQLTASAGLAFVDSDPVSSQELLRRADLAMFRVKHRGGGQLAAARAPQRDELSNRLREEGLLREAIAGDGLLTYLQGEWDLRSGELIGAEALARWQHPTLGVREAGAFIGIAEESDLVIALGERVLQTACGQLAAWRQSGFDRPFVLRVNLSARQLRHPSVVDQLRDTLSDTGLSPGDLCLELTESSLLMDPRLAASTLERIRELGCGLAVDDFGTGYSSLMYLKNLPLTCIKVDRVFVSGLPHDHTDRAIIASIVELANALGVTVTAEGVETAEQREALAEIGCQCAQGFFFSRPEPTDAFAGRIGATS